MARASSTEASRRASKRRADKRSPTTPPPSAAAANRDKRSTQGAADVQAAAEPQALLATCSFDPGETGEPYSATVLFTGRRVGVRGSPKPHDRFAKEERVEEVVPGTGPISITTIVRGVARGRWTVDARLKADLVRDSPAGGSASRAAVQPAAWSWRRWSVSPAAEALITTRWALLAPLARQPAVLPGVYPLLVALTVPAILGLQALILATAGVPVGGPLGATVVGAGFGLLGAKLWYAALHRDQSVLRGGWAVDGFFIVAPLATAVTLLALDLPIGIVFDATTPGLFFGVALGRVGCFVTGCCAGRCTASRWGIWSSDRRVGARRIPAQLLEAGAGLLIGLVALAVVLPGTSPLPGAVFVAAFASYFTARQVLLRLRAERRRDPRTVPLTAAAAVVVVVVVVGLALLQSA